MLSGKFNLKPLREGSTEEPNQSGVLTAGFLHVLGRFMGLILLMFG